MTRRHEQVAHQRKLSEIRNIMNSMKTLAIMETHKLERLILTQSKMIATIEEMAADFLYFHAGELREDTPALNTVLVIGSERGFCGGYNVQLVKKLETSLPEFTQHKTRLIALGSKLHPLLNNSLYRIDKIKGATVMEDVFNVAGEITRQLVNTQQPGSLYVLHHNNQHNELVLEKLLPPFQQQTQAKVKYSNPPVLNLTTRDFFVELTDHHLLNVLHQSLYVSLLIENQQRVQHLEHATHHLDRKTDELNRKINALRQEEIIEEIEVILLNAAGN